MAHDVFISYSTKDKHAADAMCAVLEHNHIRCWIAPRDVLPGVTWGSAILGAIHDAKLIVLVFSGNANTSPQIEREVERAINHGVPIIPFRIEDVQPSSSLEYFISASHWLDAFTEPMEQHLETLAKVVHHIIGLKQGKEDEVGAIVGSVNEHHEGAKPATADFTMPRAAQPRSKQWLLAGGGAAAGAIAAILAVVFMSQARKPPASQPVAQASVQAPVAQQAITQVAAAAPAAPQPAAPQAAPVQSAPVQVAVVPPPAAQPPAAPPPIAPAVVQPAALEPPLAQAPPAATGPSIAGRWTWDAVCAGTRWHGKFDVADTSQGHFNGNFDATEWYDVGAISNGQFDGTSVSFTRSSGTYVQHWKGHLVQGRLEGSATASNANCTWVATRD